MAKRIFCDVCGDEMKYEDVPAYLKNGNADVEVKGHEKKLQFSVRVFIEAENVQNGEHIDICHDCRLYLLDKLDSRPRSE